MLVEECSEQELNGRNHVKRSIDSPCTFKVITLAASLEENIIDLIKDMYHDSGAINVEVARIKCWKSGGHGTQTFMQVVQNSCNLLVNTGTHLSLLRTL